MPTEKEKQALVAVSQSTAAKQALTQAPTPSPESATAFKGYVKGLQGNGPAQAQAAPAAAVDQEEKDPEVVAHEAKLEKQVPGLSKVQNTRPVADEVMGIPAKAIAKPGDDEAIVSTEKTEKKTAAQFGQGKAGVDRTTTVTTKEGDKTNVQAGKTSVAVGKDKGLELGRTTSTEDVTGADPKTQVGVKETKSKALAVNTSGGQVKVGKETETREGADKVTKGADTTIGLKDGKLSAERATKEKREGAAGGTTSTTTTGFADGKLKRGWGEEKETKRKVQEVQADGSTKEVEKTSKSGTSTSVSVGRDSVAAEQGWSKTNEAGTSSKTTVGGQIDANGNASVNAGHSVTSKSGNSVKVSVKAGVEVHASEPVQDGDRWIVAYKRTKSAGAGAGGSAKGAGVTVGGSTEGFESGTRHFKTKKEAEDFREHAAERIAADQADATTAEGALKMAEGETRGKGSSKSGTLGGSVAVEGATFAVSGTKKSTEEVQVRRVSGNIVQATYKTTKSEGVEASTGGMGVTTGAGKSETDRDSVTVEFDLGTDEGRKAFEQFAKDHKVPKAGKLLSEAKGKAKEKHDGTKIAGLGEARWQQGTDEETVTDTAGKHETYKGANSKAINPTRLARWTGDKQVNSSVEIIGRQENDKDAGYTVEGKFSGESGTHNRAKMRSLMGVEEDFDEKKVEGKASGEWTMSADIDAKTMAAEHKYGKRYQGLKTNDERMKATAQAVAEKGSRGVNSIEAMGDKPLDWDVELKGDKNFPGKSGRLELEAKIKRWQGTLAKTPAEAPAVLGEVQAELDVQKARRAGVADPKKYVDLPDALRRQQLKKIDEQIGKLEGLRHQAGVEATKNKPGEKIGDVLNRHYAPKDAGYKGLSAEQTKVAKLRDELAESDNAIKGFQEKNREARLALIHAASHTTDFSKATPEYRKRMDEGFRSGNALSGSAEKQYKAADEMRVVFLKNASDPKAALPIGQSLDAQLKAIRDLAGNAWAQYEQACIAQVNMNKDGNLGKYAGFWADIASNSMDAEDFTPPAEPEPEPEEKAPKVSMALGK